MGVDLRNTWQQPNPFIVLSMTAAEIAAIGTPIEGMLVYDSTNDKFAVYQASAWKRKYEPRSCEREYSFRLAGCA